MFAALAEFIRELIVQGTNEGLDAAREVKRLARRITSSSPAAGATTVSADERPRSSPSGPAPGGGAPDRPAGHSRLHRGARHRQSVGAALVHGTIPAVWPLVVLALGAMAYDIALRALRHRER